jgi:hypothetical protein
MHQTYVKRPAVPGTKRVVVSGVKMTRVDESVAREAVKDLKLNVKPTDDLERIVELIAASFDTLPSSQVGQCSVCSGSSDMELERCPYCGSRDSDGEEDTEPKVEAAVEVEEQTLVKLPKRKKAEPAVVDAELVAEASSKLAKVEEEIGALTRAGAQNFWEIGGKIAEVYDAKLWEHKSSPYRTFDAWVIKQTPFTLQSAYKIMDVHKAFTKEDAGKFGWTKLALVARVDKSDQPRLLDALESGASRSEIAEQIKTTKKAKPQRHESGKSEGASQQKKPRPEAKITIASLTGKQVVKLYARVTKKDAGNPKRAKRLADHPWGSLQLENNAILYFNIQQHANGELSLVVMAERKES